MKKGEPCSLFPSFFVFCRYIYVCMYSLQWLRFFRCPCSIRVKIAGCIFFHLFLFRERTSLLPFVYVSNNFWLRKNMHVKKKEQMEKEKKKRAARSCTEAARCFSGVAYCVYVCE